MEFVQALAFAWWKEGKNGDRLFWIWAISCLARLPPPQPELSWWFCHDLVRSFLPTPPSPVDLLSSMFIFMVLIDWSIHLLIHFLYFNAKFYPPSPSFIILLIFIIFSYLFTALLFCFLLILGTPRREGRRCAHNGGNGRGVADCLSSQPGAAAPPPPGTGEDRIPRRAYCGGEGKVSTPYGGDGLNDQ